MAPTTLRYGGRSDVVPPPGRPENPGERPIELTLSYRAPLQWEGLLALLRRDAMPGVESVERDRYARTVRLGDATGAILVENVAGGRADPRRALPRTHLVVRVSPSLLPTLMPLIQRVRRLFDLDAEPSVIDDHRARTGLAPLVRRRPSVRLPGAVVPCELVLLAQVRAGTRSAAAAEWVMRRLVWALGEPARPRRPGAGRGSRWCRAAPRAVRRRRRPDRAGLGLHHGVSLLGRGLRC
ncbi:MAG TPA: AlkA N-terminal domain-containing protein [Vicinamibacterales bacterium]|nr:AlkA N-terminal domain-containing protein [Vicinamibacterales bacterium]